MHLDNTSLMSKSVSLHHGDSRQKYMCSLQICVCGKPVDVYQVHRPIIQVTYAAGDFVSKSSTNSSRWRSHRSVVLRRLLVRWFSNSFDRHKLYTSWHRTTLTDQFCRSTRSPRLTATYEHNTHKFASRQAVNATESRLVSCLLWIRAPAMFHIQSNPVISKFRGPPR
jgi:hypothetical protein